MMFSSVNFHMSMQPEILPAPQKCPVSPFVPASLQQLSWYYPYTPYIGLCQFLYLHKWKHTPHILGCPASFGQHCICEIHPRSCTRLQLIHFHCRIDFYCEWLFCIYSDTDGQLDRRLSPAIMNWAAMDILVRVFWWIYVHISPGHIPWKELIRQISIFNKQLGQVLTHAEI